MEVKTCRRCGGIFQYLGGKLVCPKCKKKEEEMFQVVKGYLKENVGATLDQVSEDTGVSRGMIEGFLREGRLEVTADSPISLACEICGAPIRTGRLCFKCNNDMSSGFKAVAKEMKPDPVKTEPKHEGERMRYLDHK